MKILHFSQIVEKLQITAFLDSFGKNLMYTHDY